MLPHRSCSSAISEANWRKRCGKGAAGSSPGFPNSRIPCDPPASPTHRPPKHFYASKLAWDELCSPPHAGWLDWYRRILRVRRERVTPLLVRAGRCELIGEEAVVVRWRVGQDGELTLAANLSDAPANGFPAPSGSILWQEGAPPVGAPWSVCWWLT